jgi:preprotein translocase subunit SecD
VHIIEERTVGPSLGHDSIRDGTRAVVVGTILVVLFMLIYYQASGFLSVTALVLNIYLLLALLAGFGATLTLPGIAGIALTVGMAVDANVLILERIREELRSGKTVRSAINTGYDRAFRTILDANVTTLISAVFLFQFGTGPIRGFAVTLSLGLIVNMFTAVLFTRLIYDMITQRKTLKKLSI